MQHLERLGDELHVDEAAAAELDVEPAGPISGRLAKSLEYPSRKEFLQDYRRRTAWVRALYERVVRP